MEQNVVELAQQPADRAIHRTGRCKSRYTGCHAGSAGARAGRPDQGPGQHIGCRVSRFCDQFIHKLKYLYIYEIRIE